MPPGTPSSPAPDGAAVERLHRKLADWLADVALNPEGEAAAESNRREAAGLPVQRTQRSTRGAGAK
jgi:hypothetical protein